jgi:hypothetical protein
MQEYCTTWFENGRRRNVHPVTGEAIDPDSLAWDEIEETCSDFIYDVPIGEMKHPGNSVRIPDRKELRVSIQQLAQIVWPNTQANMRSSYGSTDGASDLFSGEHWNLPYLVCPSTVSDGWQGFQNIR